MKSVWKGSISFGLVSIEVQLFTAVQPHVLAFTLLHAKCHTPLHNKRWCEHCKQEVSWSDVIKGMPLDNGKYFIMTPKNLQKFRPEKTDTINIIEFIDSDAIDPIYTDQHYYAVPTKESASKAYDLLIAALKDLNKVAIGQVVFKNREHVCALQPYKGTLLLTTLNYGYEIRSTNQLPTYKHARISKAELNMAEQLIKKNTRKTFSIEKYKDSYAEKLLAAVKRGHSTRVTKRKIPKKKRESLTEQLAQSLRRPTAAPAPVAYAKKKANHKVVARGRNRGAKKKV